MKRLSSLVLTLYALGGVVLCLAVGLVLAQVPPYAAAMSKMNQGPRLRRPSSPVSPISWLS